MAAVWFTEFEKISINNSIKTWVHHLSSTVGDSESMFKSYLLTVRRLNYPKSDLALFFRIEKILKYPTPDLAMMIWQCIR